LIFFAITFVVCLIFFLWSPYGIGQTIIFALWFLSFFFLSSLFLA